MPRNINIFLYKLTWDHFMKDKIILNEFENYIIINYSNIKLITQKSFYYYIYYYI